VNPRFGTCIALLGVTLLAGCGGQPASAVAQLPSIETSEHAVDAKANPQLYVTNNDGAVRIFSLSSDKGNVAPTRTIAGGKTGIANPAGIAFAPDGQIAVANVLSEGGAVHALVFAPKASGDANPLRAISCGGTTVPLGVAYDTNGNLYVTNGKGGNDVVVFAPSDNGCVNGNRIIAGANTTLLDPYGVRVDAKGTIYVANPGTGGIVEFAPGASGNATPAAVIAGDKTGLGAPSDLALDAANELIVSDLRADTIEVFAAGSNGNVVPLRTIAGSNTGLNGPNGLTLDAAGNIFVANLFANSITEYAAGANGNVTPLRTIAGPKTGLSGPYKLTIGPG